MWFLNYYCSDGSCFRKGHGFFFWVWHIGILFRHHEIHLGRELGICKYKPEKAISNKLKWITSAFIFIFFHHQMDYFCLYFHLISFLILILIRSFYYCVGTEPSKMPHVPAKNHLSSFRVSFLII